MGAGWAGVASIRTKRKFIGMESDAEFFNDAVSYCQAELNRYPLFAEPKPKQLELL